MKPPEEAKRKLVEQWIAKAEEDLKAAQVILSQEPLLLSPVGFHAQQAAEKYLKAFLAWHEIDSPKTHDLDLLLDLVQTIDKPMAGMLRDVIVLTPYGVELRYPGDVPEPTSDETKEALALAGKVQEAVLNALKEHNI